MFTVNSENKTYEISYEKGNCKGIINDKEFSLDIIKTGEITYHLIKDDISYNISLIDINYDIKNVIIQVNGENFNINIEDEVDVLLKEIGISTVVNNISKDIKAPMPGMLANIYVKEGDKVKQGDILFVLEAMKMENNIKSPIDATVKTVKAVKGVSVEKNELLIIFE